MADIILVVVGLIIIVISFVISENDKDEEKDIPAPVMTRELLESSIDDLNEVITKKFDRKFEERWEETIADADDQMGQISNEKIMAVHDFSAEVLEKINQNHEDVIFLYKMLNDKEEELKQMALEIDKSKSEWQDFYKKQKQREYDNKIESTKTEEEQNLKRREKIRIMDSLEGLSRRDRLKLLEAMDKGEVIPDMDDLNPYDMTVSDEGDVLEGYFPNETEFQENPDEAALTEEPLEDNGNLKEGIDNPAERQAEKLRKERQEKERKHREKTGNMAAFTGSNWNQEVLRLYKEGKSVQEISKLLKKGQGEVKLVLDLFKKTEQAE